MGMGLKNGGLDQERNYSFFSSIRLTLRISKRLAVTAFSHTKLHRRILS